MAISVIGGSSSAGAGQQYQQIFTSSGTWNKPTGVKTAEVTVLGGGGTAMSGSQAGGGAGGYYKGIFDVSGASSYTVTVGAGAAWNTARGGNSSFGNLVIARGGESYSSSTGTNFSGEILFPTAPQPKNLQLKSGYAGTNFYGGGSGLNTVNRIVYGNGIYLYVPGLASTSSYMSQYLTSTDGFQTRTVRSLPENNYLWNVFFVNGYFWLFNAAGFYKSTDGINWGSRTNYSGFSMSYGSPNGMAYANGWFVYANGSSTVYRSQDGITWSSVSVAFGVYWPKAANGVLFGLNTGNNSNSVQYSSDGGATWKSLSTTYYAEDVAYFNGYYHISHHWSASIIYVYTMDGSGNLNFYTSYSNGSYGGQIAADTASGYMYRINSGTLYSSTDGFNWTTAATSVYDASTTNRTLDLVAMNGFVLMSRGDDTNQPLLSIQFAFGITGFPGYNSYLGGGAVSAGQQIYSYNNSGYRWGTDTIQNDPLLIGCGMGGQYVVSGSTYDRFPIYMYQNPRYGSGGYTPNTNSSGAVAGGNGIVIVRWWA
jgi:hypothetical protein